MSSIPVPFLDLSRAMAPLRSDMDAAMARVLDSMRFVLADEGAALEAECARRLQVAGAVGVASGTDALILSYRALGLQPGDEVITSLRSRFLPRRAPSSRPVPRPALPISSPTASTWIRRPWRLPLVPARRPCALCTCLDRPPP